jgi:hypothetical protein
MSLSLSLSAIMEQRPQLIRRDMLAPVHPDDDLFRNNMPRYHSKDLCPQHSQQIRPTAQSAFVRQKNLQPFPCNRRGSSTATNEP